MHGVLWAMLGWVILCVALLYALDRVMSSGEEERHLKQRVSTVVVSKYKPADPDSYVLYLQRGKSIMPFAVLKGAFARSEVGDSIVKFPRSATYYLKNRRTGSLGRLSPVSDSLPEPAFGTDGRLSH
ncbi:hypothetical protein GCM10027175_32650 [Hymenobacter latericoloratus]